MRQRRPPSWDVTWLVVSTLLVLAGCPLTEILSAPGARGSATWILPALYWVVALVSLVASTLVFLRQSYLRGERELRRRQGLCPECGYDLRATPGRCPECGSATLEVVRGAAPRRGVRP